MFVNESFWNDNSKILQELQLEGHRNDYIESYIRYVEMQCTTYKLVTKGKFLCAKLTFFITNTSFLNIVIPDVTKFNIASKIFPYKIGSPFLIKVLQLNEKSQSPLILKHISKCGTWQ